MRTSEEMPELSIWGTPFRLMMTLRPPSLTMDCSASLSCSLGSPIVKRPRTSSKLMPFCRRTEISMGRCSVISDLFGILLRRNERLEHETRPFGLYDRWRVLDNHSIGIFNSSHENSKRAIWKSGAYNRASKSPEKSGCCKLGAALSCHNVGER